LLVVADNGFNMIKTVKVANVTGDISETDVEEQKEELNEEREIDDGDTEDEQEDDVAGTGLTTEGMEQVIQVDSTSQVPMYCTHITTGYERVS
jgi:hypothetical protein